jgi:hypothetical protein
VTAGDFIIAAMRKTTSQLRLANIESAAKQHEIPVGWAVEYRDREIAYKEQR